MDELDREGPELEEDEDEEGSEVRVSEEEEEVEPGSKIRRYVLELDLVGEAERYRQAGYMPLLDPRMEEFARQYVALGGRFRASSRSVGLDPKDAWRMMRRSPLLRARIRYLTEQYLSNVSREEIIQKMVAWMKEGRPNERVRIAETLLKLLGAFPAQQMQVVSVVQPAGGTRYVQAAQTLRQYAEKLDSERLKAIRSHLLEEMQGIQEALQVLDEIEGVRQLPGVSEH